MLQARLISELPQLTALREQWDELASTGELPMMAPACVLAWWRHLAPAGAQLRAVAVHESGELVGLAPFYLDRSSRGRLDLRLPGIELAGRLAPLARAGREREVGEALAGALARMDPLPDVIALEGAPLAASWGRSLRQGWPGGVRPPSRRYSVHGSPTVSLDGQGSFQEWLGARSSNFRSQMRRLRRQFEQAGGSGRASTAQTLTDDVDAFIALHAARWRGRGESKLLSAGAALREVLLDIGGSLIAQERFRLRLLEIDGEAICAQLFLAAGGRVLYVNGGWDEAHARLKPPMLAILAMIEEGFARGERCLDLGVGDQPYKRRFADGDDPVAWTVLLAPRARLPLTWLRLAPTIWGATLRRIAKRRASAGQLERYRRLRRRLRGA
jgi:CelD/BcsL family acetyltransferase involved in cellulose biosynthesis